MQPQDYSNWTIRAAYLRDPDGNLLEVWAALGQSKWSERATEDTVKFSGSFAEIW